MHPISLEELATILQTSISPVVLISAVGLLLLSMTNRLGRTIDRARILSKEIKKVPPQEAGKLIVEIKILYRRSKILRSAISCASFSILCTSLMIVSLFAIYIYGFILHSIVVYLFVVSLVFLVASLVLFIKDLSVSLNALRLEIEEHI